MKVSYGNTPNFYVSRYFRQFPRNIGAVRATSKYDEFIAAFSRQNNAFRTLQFLMEITGCTPNIINELNNVFKLTKTNQKRLFFPICISTSKIILL